MKSIAIQIQPDRNAQLDVAAIIAWLRGLAGVEQADVSEGDDDGRYVNFTCNTNNPAALWPLIHAEIQKPGSHLAQCCIVTCQGEEGWDDYLLLYSYDKDQQLDKV